MPYDPLDTFEIETVEGEAVLFCLGCGNGVEQAERYSLAHLIKAAREHKCEPVTP